MREVYNSLWGRLASLLRAPPFGPRVCHVILSEGQRAEASLARCDFNRRIGIETD
jgi:hypothetical protein